MDEITEQIIIKYVKKLYYHNFPTYMHSLRVGDKLYHFCQYLGCENLKHIYMFGILHDIGKLKIPSSLLDKTRKLTTDEFEEIKKHTIYGRDIFLSLHQFPQEYATYVLYHHENVDATGYFHKKDIPYLSRVIRIVDTYDTMLYGRTYQKPLSQETIINEIISLKGSFFDSKLVDQFIEMLSGKYSLETSNLLEVNL